MVKPNNHHFSAFPPKFRNGGEGVRGRHLYVMLVAKSGKLIPLLLASTIPRNLPAFVATTSYTRNSAHSIGRKQLKLFSSSDKRMTDEVTEAKAAAASYVSSDEDGVGPATVFDNILSGKWPSDKVHEDDLSLAFRE